MIFLASFALRGLGQASLVVATLALLGVLFAPATWLSGAIIALVTLVHGERQGVVSSLVSALGAAVLATLLFQEPQLALGFVALVWMPAWFLAMMLRRTVSLAYSLQVFTGICLLAVTVLYAVFPGMGEGYRELIEQFMFQLADNSEELDPAKALQLADWVVVFLPAVFVISTMFVALFSLLLGRWWQAVLYNPGGFAREFQALDLGKVSAVIALVITVASILIDGALLIALISVVVMLYTLQGLSLMHALVNIRNINAAWLVLLYLLMFFVPHLMLILFILALLDPWLDFRNQKAKQA